ncbi:MAG: Wzz/FepE/Etk N-terminal domain-containing protein [Solirubrobacteraceae bacterium]
MDEHVEPRNTQRIAPILWRGRFIILASVAVMLLLALIYTARSAKVYEATAILQVSVPNQGATADTTAANQGLAQNYATLLVSPGFLGKIRQQVDSGRLSTSQLESRLHANALLQTALVELHSTGPSPRAAQTLGQQVAQAFLANLQSEANSTTAQQQSQIERTVVSLSTRIAALQALPTAGIPPTSEQISSLLASRAALITQTATLVANGLAQGTSATLSAPPSASSSPISPRRSLNLLAGLLLGLLLGVGITWMRHVLQPGLRSSEEAAALVGEEVPVLASIPLTPMLKSKDPTLPEAYSILQTNLFFAMRNQKFRLLTFVGPNPRVGKTSVVEGLANAAVRGGQSVLIVDGDMRAGTLSSRYGKSHHAGLADLLQGTVDLDDTLVSLNPGLSLLPTRPSQINPPSLLSGERMRTLSAELREHFDIVLIDSPPIGGLADGLILASLSDAVVMVVRAGLTTPADLTGAATSLHQSHTPIAGMVVFEERLLEPYYPLAEQPEPGERDPVAHDPAMLS